MSRIKYRDFIIVFTLILCFLLGNTCTKTSFASNQETVNPQKDSIYKETYLDGKKLDRTIIIGDDKNYPPYSFIDENGNPAGFNVELAKAAAEAMGLNVKIKLGSWSDVRRELESGEIDAISGISYSKDREKVLSFTTKHTVTSGDVFTRKGTNIKDISKLKGLTVVVQAGDIVMEHLKKQNFDINFIQVPTVEEALKLVSIKKYDYAAASKISGHYFIKKDKYLNLQSNGLLVGPNDYCFAVKKGNDDLLFTLNGGLQILKATGKFDKIYDKWLGVYEKKTIYQTLKPYIWLIVFAVSIIILLILWNLTMKTKVTMRTRELSQANDDLSDSQEELLASNEEIEQSFNELSAIEEELRWQYEKLIESEENLKKSEERSGAIVSAIPDIIFIVDEKGIFKDCPTGEDSVLIMPKNEFIGKTLWEVLPPKIAEIGFQKIKKALENNSLESFEYDIDTPTGNRYYELRIVKCRQNEVIAISRDITMKYIAEEALAEEKELLKTTLLSVGEGVIVTDINCNITMLNMAAETIIGWEEKEAIAVKFEDIFNIIDEDTEEKSDNPIKKVLENFIALQQIEYKILITKEYEKKMISYNVSRIRDNYGEVKGAVLVFRDVTVERKNQKQIELLSFHDQLTGLYNRRFYEEELRRLDTERNLPLTIVMGDVNGLKLINDSFGHDVGDELLKKVAEVLKLGCRGDDIVARLGGDEFVIILPKTDATGVEQIIKRINDLSSKEKIGSMNISISFGYETKNNMEEKTEEIFKKAEDHMYKRKLFESPSMRGKTINTIIKTLHETNKREEQHSHRVSSLCKSMGEALRLSQYEIQELKNIGLLHDIGKIAIDENILNKPGRLTESEWNEIKRHPEIGYRILNTVDEMSDIASYVLYHHERWDGTGYPKGLKGEEIPFISRIITIVDAYDAMTSERSYRNALPVEVAISELLKNAEIQFDSRLVNVFIEKVLNK
ncbi:HD domain-containing phosphohydrolase [Clostridium sp.]|uniref:diguanylate cyclase n=1 Tax=Clostridium sp. TaxID=1506 RepID=UPI003D6C83D1